MALERVEGRRDSILDRQVRVNVAHPLNSTLNINACKWTVTRHMLLSREASDMGNDTDRDSGMQGQRISLVVNVAYMHHWAKPSQTVIRRSAIWRWPLAYSGEASAAWDVMFLILQQCRCEIISVMLKASRAYIMLTNHWCPPANALSLSRPRLFPFLLISGSRMAHKIAT